MMIINRLMQKYRLMNDIEEGGEGGEPDFDPSEFLDEELETPEGSEEEGEETPEGSEEAPASVPETPEGSLEPEAPAEPTPVEEETPTPDELQKEAPADSPVEVEEQPTQTSEELTIQKDKWMGELAERYKLSEEDADTMISSPEKVLPQLAANMHAQIMGDVLRAVGDLIPQALAQAVQAQPQVIAKAMTSHQSAQEQRNGFFKSYPKLVGQEKMVAEAAKTVKVNFPKLSLEDQIVKTGQVAMAMLGLQVEAPQQEVPSEPVQEPFMPAKSGKATLAAEGTSEWEEFI